MWFGTTTGSQRWSVVAPLLAVLVLVGGACTSTHPKPEAIPTIAGWTERPAVAVPFRVDHGALTVRTGSAPSSISRARAITEADEAMGFPQSTVVATEVLHGRVTVDRTKADVDADVGRLDDVPAWVIVHHADAGCPVQDTVDLHSYASLQAYVITGTGPGHIVDYDGAGWQNCGVRARATATRPARGGFGSVLMRGTFHAGGGPAPGVDDPVSGTVIATNAAGRSFTVDAEGGAFKIWLDPGSYTFAGTAPRFTNACPAADPVTVPPTGLAAATSTIDLVCPIP